MKKQTKRYNMILIGLILVLLVFIVVWKLQKREDLYFHVGIAVYDLGDSFIESYIEELQEQIEEHNIAGKKVSYEIYDARGISTQQEKQLQYMYAQEYDLERISQAYCKIGIFKNDSEDGTLQPPLEFRLRGW